METTQITGGGFAQSEIDETSIFNPMPRYIEAANPAQVIHLGDVIDPATMALDLISDARAMLQAAMAINPNTTNSTTHLRAMIKAVLIRLDQDGNTIDCELERLFLRGVEVTH